MTEYGRIHTDGSRSGGQPVLKPCPNVLCGSANILIWQSDKRKKHRTWAIMCRDCGASVPQGYDNEAEAIAAWNTRQPAQSDALQADIDAMESILWVDTIIDDREAIAKVFARHREYGYDQGYYDGCEHTMDAEEALRKALQHIANLKWDTMTQGCNAACEAAKIAKETLDKTK